MEFKSIYSNHAEQREAALPLPERAGRIEEALVKMFKNKIQYREVPFVLFDQVTVEELAEAFFEHPVIVKALVASVNVAQRAIKRDLGIDIDTYAATLTRQKAGILAGYIKPMLPKEMPVPALLMLDHHCWVDKEMRAEKGRWESTVSRLLNAAGTVEFRKRRFVHNESAFELDAGYPAKSTVPVAIGVDVKRYESPRDFHKRGDEITQKAAHLKAVYPGAKFYAVIYYPFPAQHEDVLRRYQGQQIDGIFFAGTTDESLAAAVAEILGSNNLLKRA